jgi:hypothetical protein
MLPKKTALTDDQIVALAAQIEERKAADKAYEKELETFHAAQLCGLLRMDATPPERPGPWRTVRETFEAVTVTASGATHRQILTTGQQVPPDHFSVALRPDMFDQLGDAAA